MRNRKNKHNQPDEEGAPAWMNTYGDMITLLLTFFVLMFAFSTIDAQKWEQFVSSLSGTPFVAIQSLELSDANETNSDTSSWETPPPTPAPGESLNAVADADAEEIKKQFNELYEKIKNHIEKNNLGYILNVEKKEQTILLRMTNSALFDSGSDEIKADAKAILVDISDIISEYTDLIKKIQIEGHTDNVPMHTAEFGDNWELSTSRAVQVVRYLLTILDIDPAKLTPTGYGEYHPVASNDTERGKAQNRRVDFVIESIAIDKE